MLCQLRKHIAALVHRGTLLGQKQQDDVDRGSNRHQRKSQNKPYLSIGWDRMVHERWDTSDVAYHLRMPWQLLDQGFYAPLPQYQVWALAPWLSDVVHALPILISRQEAVGAVNAFWLCALACGLWRLAACLGASIRTCWMSVIVGVSIPLTTALSAGMMTELPMAAVLVWLFALVAGPSAGGIRFWLTLAILVGGLAAIKAPGAAMAVIPLLWALFRHPWPSPAKIILVVAVALVMAGSSYVYAWVRYCHYSMAGSNRQL